MTTASSKLLSAALVSPCTRTRQAPPPARNSPCSRCSAETSIRIFPPTFAARTEERRATRETMATAPATGSLAEAGYWRVLVQSPVVHTNFTGWDEVVDTGQINELEIILLQQTPLADFLSGWVIDQQRDRIHATLDALSDQASQPRQKVVLAHIMAPHPPCLYGDMPTCWGRKACGMHDPRPEAMGITMAQYGAAFADQLEALNPQVLDTVASLIAADPDAIIVLLGDHGARHDANAAEWRRAFLAVRGSRSLEGGALCSPPLHSAAERRWSGRMTFALSDAAAVPRARTPRARIGKPSHHQDRPSPPSPWTSDASRTRFSQLQPHGGGSSDAAQ